MAVDHNNPQSRDEEILIATIDGKEYDKAPQSRMEELLLELKETIEEGGGGGGTTNYENLSNQPQINGETLIGDKTGEDLGLVDAEEGKGLSTNDYDDTEKAAVAAATSAISAIKDGVDIDSFGDVEVALLDKADTSDLGTAAAKDSTNAVTSGSTDLVESGAVKDAIDSAVSRAYHHAGTKTCAELLPALLIAANEGNVYEMTDSGTTTSDFMEGIGYPIKEGDNVGIARVSEGVYKFDLLSGFVDTTNFVQKSQTAGLLKNDGTVNTTIEDTVAGHTAAIEAIDGKIDDVTEYPYAPSITIEDAVPSNLAECKVKIEPVQDLHGYDKPWIGGANTNKYDDSTKLENKMLLRGGNYYDNSWFDMSDYIDVTGNDGYVTMSWDSTLSWYQVQLCAYDSSKQFISDSYINYENSNTRTHAFVVPNNAKYVRFSWAKQTSGGSVGQTNIRVNLGNTDLGYVSYSNICPISGHTEVDVQRDGVNLFDISSAQQGYDIKNDGSIVSASDSHYVSDYIMVKAGATYHQSVTGNWAGIGNAFYDGSKNFIGFISGHDITENSNNFTIPNGALYCRITAFEGVQLEYGESATDFVPYSGKTYTIALGSTIYGGTVDFDSGVMTVDREIVDLGGLNWDYFTGSVNYFRTGDLNSTIKRPNSATDVPNIISSIYTAHQWGGNTPDKNIIVVPSGTTGYDKYLFIRDDSYNNATTYKTAMDGVQLCYELATPTTIQLTPQQIQLLKGQNTLTASTGQISVTVNGVSSSIGAVQEQVNATDAALALKQPITDNTLQTTDKTIPGAINEVKSGLTNLAGLKFLPVTFTDKFEANSNITNGVTVSALTGGVLTSENQIKGIIVFNGYPYFLFQLTYQGKILLGTDTARSIQETINVRMVILY